MSCCYQSPNQPTNHCVFSRAGICIKKSFELVEGKNWWREVRQTTNFQCVCSSGRELPTLARYHFAIRIGAFQVSTLMHSVARSRASLVASPGLCKEVARADEEILI